jgi:hypothetical protein
VQRDIVVAGLLSSDHSLNAAAPGAIQQRLIGPGCCEKLGRMVLLFVTNHTTHMLPYIIPESRRYDNSNSLINIVFGQNGFIMSAIQKLNNQTRSFYAGESCARSAV